ncbi:Ig-like domain-containing protein [Methanobrevibacter sp.]
MKIKKIMLITMLLLAVLTVGAVSASDDVSLENMTAGDDGDVIADDVLTGSYDFEYHGIDVNEDNTIDTEDPTEEIASIDLPKNAKGSFQILNGDVVVARQDFKEEDKGDDGTWDIDGDTLSGYIFMEDFNLSNVKDGDNLSFIFKELIDGQYHTVNDFTLLYKVSLTGSEMELTEIEGSGLSEDDFNIEVSNIDFSKADENFTYVYATQKFGFFIISTDDVDVYETIFIEDLNTTTRPYVDFVDNEGIHFYKYGFSINDINNYIANNFDDVKTLKDLVDKKIIVSEDSMYFEIYEDIEDDESDIYSKELTITISSDKNILFTDEEAIDVNYENLNIEMKGDWKETLLLEFTVKKDIKGRILIYINDNQTPAYNMSLDDLPSTDPEIDYEDNFYNITVADLNITEAGKYVIREYLVDENGQYLHQYDADDPLTVELYESQEITIGNVTIKFNTILTTITGNESLIILINASENLDDVISVYVDDNKEPINIKIGNCSEDDDGNRVIGAKELNLGVGEHDLIVSYNGVNKTGTVKLQSKLIIEFPEDGEVVYTDLNGIFVVLNFEDGEIATSGIEGKINVTVKDSEGKIISKVIDFEELIPDDEGDYIITTGDVGTNLTGNCTVLVRYFNGTEAATQAEHVVTFKSFDPKDYGAVIKDIIKDKTDYVVTFTEIPLDDVISVQIDENKSVEINVDDIVFDDAKGVYIIRYSQLADLADGLHSVRVYIDTYNGLFNLTTGNVMVDLVENIDPALTISIANITEGADAVIVITTNSTFSGDVLVKIADKNYTVSLVNGTGNQTVSGLAAGSYNASAIFNANAFFKDSTKNTTFTVNPKVAISIAAPAVTTTYATSKNIVVTLKDANGNVLAGKKVTITFNGASKTIETNAKGQASYAIGTKLAPKKYDATIRFAGDDAYAPSAGTVKVTVNKAKSKMTAKKKTFKAKKKTKKYTIVLKTDKGKALKNAKVTLKIKGKTYKAKTNSKGKATFKLKKLTKKAKLKATVKFKGNKYYKPVTKKVKITIKK